MENEKLIIVEEVEKPYNIRHRCFHFSKEVLKFVGNCKYERIHFSIFDQLIRSATSIGANVVEGGSGSTKKILSTSFTFHLNQQMKQNIGCA